jgi:hypothetical protein
MRAAALALVLFTVLPALASAKDHWVGTWATAVVGRPQPGTAPQPGPAGPPPATPGRQAGPAAAPAPGRQGGAPPPPLVVNNQTLRQIVRTSIGGSKVRIVLSNAFGTAPIEIGAAYVALRDKDAAIAASGHAVTFSGRTAFRIPAAATTHSRA